MHMDPGMESRIAHLEEKFKANAYKQFNILTTTRVKGFDAGVYSSIFIASPNSIRSFFSRKGGLSMPSQPATRTARWRLSLAAARLARPPAPPIPARSLKVFRLRYLIRSSQWAGKPGCRMRYLTTGTGVVVLAPACVGDAVRAEAAPATRCGSRCRYSRRGRYPRLLNGQAFRLVRGGHRSAPVRPVRRAHGHRGRRFRPAVDLHARARRGTQVLTWGGRSPVSDPLR